MDPKKKTRDFDRSLVGIKDLEDNPYGLYLVYRMKRLKEYSKRLAINSSVTFLLTVMIVVRYYEDHLFLFGLIVVSI